MEGNAAVYQMNPGSRITGEGRAKFLETWGPDFDLKGAVVVGRRRGGRVGQVGLGVETVHPLRG